MKGEERVELRIGRRRIGRAVGLLGVPAIGLVIAQMVLAAPPTADFTISDTTPEVGDTVTFQSTSTDDDDDIASYEWDFDYDGTFNADPSATAATASTTYDSPGARSVALRITDGIAGDDTADPAIRVRSLNVVVTPPPNQAPIAVIDCPPGPVNVNVTIVCDGTNSSDPDGSISEYEWSLDGGAFTDGGVTFSTAFGSAGTHTIRLRVRDNNGTASVPAAASVTVNGPPTANIGITVDPPLNLPPDATVNTALNRSAPLVGQTVHLSSEGSTDDPGGSIESQAWDVDGDGLFNDGTDAVLHHAFTTPGIKTVHVRVVDNNGAAATASAPLRVNSLPQASFVPDNPTPVINQSVAFFSTSSDPDNDITSHAWDFDNDGQFGEPQSGDIDCQGPQSASPSCQFANADTHTVRLRITDAGGISRVATRQILIQSTVPRGAFTISPDAPLPGQAVTFSSTSTPSPNKQLTGYAWDLDYDGVTFTTDAVGHTVTGGFSSAGPKTVALRVSEGMPGGGPATGGYAIVSRTITVNAPPRAGLQISPPSPFVGDTATISSTAVDPDGPIASQNWDLDNDGQYDDAAGPLASASYSTAGPHTVHLRVTDSRGAVATASGVIDVRARPLVTLSGVVIGIKGRLQGKFTRLRRLRVQAPKGTTVTVKCKGKGKGCPKQAVKRGMGRTIRFKALERRFIAGTKVIVTVTKPGFIGKQTTFTMRRSREPKRVDLCLAPGAKRATACPA